MSSTNCNGLRLTFRVRTLRLPAWVTLRALLMKSRSCCITPPRSFATTSKAIAPPAAVLRPPQRTLPSKVQACRSEFRVIVPLHEMARLFASAHFAREQRRRTRGTASLRPAHRQMMNQDSRHFTEEIEQLRQRLIAMAGLAEERLQRALNGLVECNPSLLSDVIVGDPRIEDLLIDIDDRCLKLIALQQPVAIDLRTVISALKINGDLERVGDLAVNVAKAAQRYLQHPPIKPLIDIPRMGDLALKMLREAIDAFFRRDVVPAQGVLRQDDWLDTLKDQILRELLTYMLGDRETIEPAVELIFISRHLERVGDHATNIAEDVIFLVEARDVRHRSAPQAVERRRLWDVAPI